MENYLGVENKMNVVFVVLGIQVINFHLHQSREKWATSSIYSHEIQ